MGRQARAALTPRVEEPPPRWRAADASLPEVLALSVRFRDLPFDLADASVAEAAHRLKLRHVLRLDADFDDVYRDKAGRALANLLRG